MSIVQTLLYFLLALFLLVTIHEFGHFIVARLCGVKVLRFSFGFGPVIFSRRDKKGTEYAWSLFPIGGYVKLLNEEEGPVAESEKPLAFNNKSLWRRFAIVAAGPLFNFIFAFAALWLVLVIGIQSLAPMIDGVTAGSIAEQAGLTSKHEVVALDGRKVYSWREVQNTLMPLLGTRDLVQVTLRSMKDDARSQIQLPLGQWRLEGKRPDVLASLGIIPFVPKIPPVVGMVAPKSPAAAAGFQIGDRVLTVDGLPISDWLDLLDIVKKSPGKLMSVTVKRHKHIITLPIELGRIVQGGHEIGQLGVRSKRMHWPEGWLRTQRETPLDATVMAARQTTQMIGSTFALLGRMLSGKLSWHGVSGPIGIAQGAGESARGGLSYYLYFLALISVSLGVLNLLPIPLLDGGHLFYYVIELVCRQPLSERVRVVGMYAGFVLLTALMVLAVTNDISRLVS